MIWVKKIIDRRQKISDFSRCAAIWNWTLTQGVACLPGKAFFDENHLFTARQGTNPVRIGVILLKGLIISEMMDSKPAEIKNLNG
ncbi:MAG: hypothetical protein MI756_01160 [Chromatiales bacterium]|nr:hypothetical protein [Chromatiales bacterium]